MSSKKRKSESSQYSAQIFDHIRRIVRALRVTSRRAEKELGLTAAQLFVLQRLKVQSSMTLKEVAEATLTDPSTVSGVVQRLVEKGYVERKQSIEDRREIRLSLSPSGAAQLRQGFLSFQEILSDAIQKMPKKRQQALAELLGEACERSGISKEPLTMFFENEETIKTGP